MNPSIQALMAAIHHIRTGGQPITGINHVNGLIGGGVQHLPLHPLTRHPMSAAGPALPGTQVPQPLPDGSFSPDGTAPFLGSPDGGQINPNSPAPDGQVGPDGLPGSMPGGLNPAGPSLVRQGPINPINPAAAARKALLGYA